MKMLRRSRLSQLSKDTARRARRTAVPRRFISSLETLEDRRLMATGFLQGITFDDLNLNNRFDQGEALAGAKVQLFNPDNTPVLQVGNPVTATTGLDGT